jgi:NADH:ubiquinone oxidoreductase subunit
MGLLSQLFTWWNGQTLGTRLFTWRKGTHVGTDEQGNRYYTYKARRWVIFNGETEATRVSPDWHGWLHHTFDEMPGGTPLTHKPWEQPHQPNQSGTTAAYHPPGSLHAAAPAARQDYEAWKPE